MSSEDIRLFKHELRTPINHIIGYSELLIETAEDEGNTAVGTRAKAIHSCGQVLATMIDRQLAGLTDRPDAVSAALRDSALPTITEILDNARGAARLGAEAHRDFQRIDAAVHKLLNILEVQGEVAAPSK